MATTIPDGGRRSAGDPRTGRGFVARRRWLPALALAWLVVAPVSGQAAVTAAYEQIRSGSTPTAVPMTQPTKAHIKLMGVAAVVGLVVVGVGAAVAWSSSTPSSPSLSLIHI